MSQERIFFAINNGGIRSVFVETRELLSLSRLGGENSTRSGTQSVLSFHETIFVFSIVARKIVRREIDCAAKRKRHPTFVRVAYFAYFSFDAVVPRHYICIKLGHSYAKSYELSVLFFLDFLNARKIAIK